MALVPYTSPLEVVCAVDRAADVFGILRAGIPPRVLETACTSQVAISLVPLTSNTQEPPNRADIEQHFDLLSKFMTRFPRKAPAFSTLSDGML